MGGAASKAARRYPSAKPSVAGTPRVERVYPPAAVGAAELEVPVAEVASADSGAAQTEPPQQDGTAALPPELPDDDGQWDRNDPQTHVLDRLAGAITNRDAGIQPQQAGSTTSARLRRPHSHRQREEASEQRLAVSDLRRLLQEASGSAERGTAADVSALAAKYHVDEALLRQTLRYVRLPKLKTGEDGSITLVN